MSWFVEEREGDTPWAVIHILSRRAGDSPSPKEKSPFNGMPYSTKSLDIRYRVEPKEDWAAIKKYSNCKVSEQAYGIQDYVFVQPSGASISEIESKGDMKEVALQDFWVARIVEIGAIDEGHVYARVFWMYWPEDLPLLKDCGVTQSGRRNYHGKHELIASNHMEVVDVCTFAGLASVTCWKETHDEETQTDLYWRQTFDYRTAQLSVLTKYCICKRYYNPDKVIVSCPNLDCAIWLHAECLVDKILTQKCQSLNNTSAEAVQDTIIIETQEPKPKARKVKILQTKKLYEGIFSAELVGGEGDDPPQAEITDLRLDIEHEMRKWKEAIVCPKCATKIE